MNKPKAPKEDPAVAAAREREERRAEASRTAETQALLLGDTTRRFRRYGRLAGGSFAGTVAPSMGGSGGGGLSGLDGSAGGSSGGGLISRLAGLARQSVTLV